MTTKSSSALPTRWPENFRPDDVTAPVHGVLVKDRIEHGDARGVGQHAHKTGQLTITLSGWVGLSVGGSIVALPAGTAAWVPSGVAHEGILGENASSWYVHFAEPLCAELPKTIERFFISNLALEAARRFIDRNDPFDADSPLGRIARVLIDEIRSAERLKPGFAALSTHPLLKAVAEAIIAEPDMRLSREDYAEAAGISGRQLSRILAAETGRGFGDWRLDSGDAASSPRDDHRGRRGGGGVFERVRLHRGLQARLRRDAGGVRDRKLRGARRQDRRNAKGRPP